jgi:predicted metal-dependent HD superfamily phosphohydrolase
MQMELEVTAAKVKCPNASVARLIGDFWQQACLRLGLELVPGDVDFLLAQYSQPHRHYHTAQYLSECIGHFPVPGLVHQSFGEVALALCFHDAIYDVVRNDNEARSAEMAHQFVIARGGETAAASRIRQMGLATRHQARPSSHEAQMLVDIDLSILGSERKRFDQYERQVREEYRAIPCKIFSAARRQVLLSF